MRDAKIFEIFEGINQIQQVVLASLLKSSKQFGCFYIIAVQWSELFACPTITSCIDR